MSSIDIKRDETVKRLEYAYAHGEISLDELEKRIEIAINTSLEEDLFRLLEDIKEPEPSTERPSYSVPESEENISAVLSAVQRKGHWNPAGYTKINVFMGSVELDFTDVELGPGTWDFEYFCALGSIELRVPEGINVQTSGTPLMAGIENKLKHKQVPGNPTIRLHGTAFMAGIEIKPPKKKRRR